MSSADWMGRNLFRRLEVAVPILDPDLRARILKETLQLYLEDDCNAWVMRADGTYDFLRKPLDATCKSAQDRLLEHYDRSSQHA
jgi:polyphosphate kinase